MTDDDPSASRPSVRRVDERLGLAVARVGLSGRTLVTYARDHVTVRTPSRPDVRDANTLDLVAPPAPSAVGHWIERFVDTTGRLGAPHVQLRWEAPAGDGGPIPDPADDGTAAALTEHGLTVTATRVLLLGDLAPSPTAPATVVPVPPPAVADPRPTDRRWHAATVLYRYDAEDTGDVATWRSWDEDAVAWRVDVQRELATAGRAQVWVAQRHGAPVARATLVHDRQGLAAVEDVVVHPVHRRLGIAGLVVHRAVATHRSVQPGSRVGMRVVPDSGAERVARRLGFVPHATVWTAVRPDPPR